MIKGIYRFVIRTILLLCILVVSSLITKLAYAQAQCGPRLRYNQWSCITSTTRCSGFDEDIVPKYYCSTINNNGWNSQGDCIDACPNDADCAYKQCRLGWARACRITEGDVACSLVGGDCKGTVNANICNDQLDGTNCTVEGGGDEPRDCWVGGATGTPAPGETPPPPNNPPPPQFPQTIKVIGVVFEDANGNGVFNSNEKILGPQGGVLNYTYPKSSGGNRTVDCDSTANTKGQVKEAIDGPLNIKHVASNGSTQLGNATMCYGGYIQMNSSGDAYIEGAVDCATTWGGSCTRFADCNCIEYNGIKCLAESDCSGAPDYKTKKDNMYKARSNSFYAKLRDFGLNGNYIGPAGWSATKNQLIPAWGMYTINVDNNEKLKIRVPDTYYITRTYLISTRGSDDPLVAPDEPAIIRNLGITDTVGAWDAGVANTGAVVVWGIRTKRATIRGKAHSMTNTTTCNMLQARPTVAPVDFTLAPLYTTKTQTGADYVEWNDLAVPGAFEPYRVDATPSASVINEYLEGESLVCQYKPDGTLIAKSAAVNATKGDQFDVEFGYKPKTFSINVKAVQITDGSTCNQIRGSTNGKSTWYSFVPPTADPTPAPQEQIGDTRVTFSSLVPGDYKIHMAPVSPVYVPFKWCIQKNSDPVASVLTTDLEYLIASANAGDIIQIDVGLGTDRAWVQTGGGDITAKNITSYIPAAGTRYFSKMNTIGFPGIVSYETSYDFNSAPGSKGEGRISTTGWLVQESSYPTIDYYQLLSTRLNAPVTDNYTVPYAGGKPTVNGTYYAAGDLSTTSAWNVLSGQQYVVFVNGNLNIDYDTTVASGGFLAFIVNGDITIGSNVGVRCDGTSCPSRTSADATVTGVYITHPAGVFKSGIGSTATNNELLVLRGSFIAGSFQLERDLGDALNPTTPAETFYYDPEILVFMPEAMKELPVTWEEVAP